MKKIYILFPFLLGMILFGSCTKDFGEIQESSTLAEGERFTATFGGYADNVELNQLRYGGVETLDSIASLRVLVFDENQKFLYSSDAILGGVAAAPTDDASYIPGSKRDGITQMKQFTVSLIKSSKLRYVHFIANYNFKGFPQDVDLVGVSAGDLLLRLQSKLPGGDGNKFTPAFSQMWSEVTFSGLDENSLNGKVVKMLRNYAKFSIKIDEANASTINYTLDKFIVCNVPDRGSVVPYETNGFDFKFPFPPSKASAPLDAIIMPNQLDTNMIPVLNTDGSQRTFNTFEFSNFSRTTAKSFIIFTAKNKTTGKTFYYKADLVRRKPITNGTSGQTISDYFDVLRNNHYQIVIRSISGDGFTTMAEAVKSPAGNNVFSSVELEDFGMISDGILTLNVNPMEKIIVREGVYTVDVSYTGVNKAGATENVGAKVDYLQFYPSWDPATDPYLGALVEKPDGTGFTVEAHGISADEIRDYFVEVIALRYYSSNPDDPSSAKVPAVDTYSGATPPLVRRVHLTLRKPFLFEAAMRNDPADATGYTKLVSFNVPVGLKESMLPVEVLFEAPDLSPVSTGTGYDMTVVYQNGKTYYKYIIRDASQLNKLIELKFRVTNGTNKTNQPIILTSDLYVRGIIGAEAPPEAYVKGKVNVRMEYGGYNYTIPTTYPMYFEIEGDPVRYTTATLYDKYNIAVVRNSDSSLSYSMPQSTMNAMGTKKMTVTTYEVYSNDYGSTTYAYTLSKTISSWFTNAATHVLPFTYTLVRGRVQGYSNGYYYSIEPAKLKFYGYSTYTNAYNGTASVDLTSYSIKTSLFDAYGRQYVAYTLNIPRAYMPTYGIGVTVDGYTAKSVKSWGNLEADTYYYYYYYADKYE